MWHYNIKLSFFFFFFFLFFFIGRSSVTLQYQTLFLHCPFVSSLKSHSLCPISKVSDSGWVDEIECKKVLIRKVISNVSPLGKAPGTRQGARLNIRVWIILCSSQESLSWGIQWNRTVYLAWCLWACSLIFFAWYHIDIFIHQNFTFSNTIWPPSLSSIFCSHYNWWFILRP